MNEQMIKNAQDGDREGINQLCINLYGPLKKVCSKNLGAKLDYCRDDALHDSLLVILQKIRGFKYESDVQFLNWCSDITYKCCKRHAKKDKVMISWPTEDLPEIVAREAIESPIGCAEIAEVISKLAPGARTNAHLYFIEEHDHAEISKMLNIKTRTSTSTISRVRPVLQQWLIKLGLYDK